MSTVGASVEVYQDNICRFETCQRIVVASIDEAGRTGSADNILLTLSFATVLIVLNLVDSMDTCRSPTCRK